jgi:oligosaccharyltransferase complex subunit beta
VKSGAPVVFRGVGHRLTGKNPLIQALLVGEPSAYSFSLNAKSAVPAAALTGAQVSLVSALQARNNARIVFSGSKDLFSDELSGTSLGGNKKNGNKEFVEELTKWVFQEKSVLKVQGTYHHREKEEKQHGAYRVKDDLVSFICMVL